MALTDNLVSYWKLDGNSDDASGAGIDGTDGASITYVTGKISQGANFNGTSLANIYAQNSAYDFNGTANFTQSLWVKVTTLPGVSTYSTHPIMTQEGTTVGTYDKGIKITGDGKVGIYAYDGAPCVSYSTTGVISTDIWYHVVGTYDGTNLRTYVNGSLVGGPTACSSTYNFTNPRIVLSQKESTLTTVTYYNGISDEVGIRSRALTSTEVSELYNSGDGLQYPFGSTGINKIYLGATQLQSLKLGSTDISTVYLGSTKVFEK